MCDARLHWLVTAEAAMQHAASVFRQARDAALARGDMARARDCQRTAQEYSARAATYAGEMIERWAPANLPDVSLSACN